MSVMLLLLAVARGIEAKTTGDQRYCAAADSVKKIEATLHRVDDGTLLKLANVNTAVEGLLSTLIAARLERVGFTLPCYEDAPAFFEPVLEQVDAILCKPNVQIHQVFAANAGSNRHEAGETLAPADAPP